MLSAVGIQHISHSPHISPRQAACRMCVGPPIRNLGTRPIPTGPIGYPNRDESAHEGTTEHPLGLRGRTPTQTEVAGKAKLNSSKAVKAQRSQDARSEQGLG